MNESNKNGDNLHPSSFRPHPSFFSKWRNAILGTLLVIAGLAAALVTVLARWTNDNGLATAGALLSLIIAALIAILIVPPLARSARLEVSEFDLPIELTTGGAIFLGIVAIVGLAAWNTGNNLLFLVFSLLTSTLFVGWATARTSLRELVVSARFPDHIFAGEAAPVIVTLRNRKRLMPSLSILVEARGPKNSARREKRKLKKSQYHKRPLAYFTYIPHNAAAEQRVEQLFKERGHVLINGFELSTRFPFGFLRRRRRLGARNVDLVVYPKPEPIGDELHLLPMYAGRMASMRRGAGHDLFSLRDYQPQDDLRHIEWKATARSRRLTVREFTSEDERRITIVLDNTVKNHLPPILKAANEPLKTARDSDAGSFRERFERGVTRAASLLKHFVDERAEVRLIIGDEVGPYGTGLEHLYQCLRRLALVTPQSAPLNTKSCGSSDDVKVGHRARSVSADDYAILITPAPPGSIPAPVWRRSYVIYF